MFERPSRDQIFVMFGMIIAILFIFAYCIVGYLYFNFTIPVIYTAEDRISFTIQWLALPIMTLLYGVFSASQARFLDKSAINGGSPAKNNYLDILTRYNQNTTEQLLLFSFTLLHFSLIIPKEFLSIIPGACILFCIGRATFHIGSLKFILLRSFGYALTFLPTLTLLSHNIMQLFFPAPLQ